MYLYAPLATFWISGELLTYMGETITVNSKYEEGSTFTFTLTKAEVPDVWD